MKIGIIGHGAIARYVMGRLALSDHVLSAILLRAERIPESGSDLHFGSVDDLPDDIDVMIDCAGSGALVSHGPGILRRGIDLITVSLAALADEEAYANLRDAALQGGVRLYLASGAIGALDCLRAASAGQLKQVTYTGRKPPRGWVGSPAENVLDLENLTSGSRIHFDGTARQAALSYPRNANVAAAVALAGLGFDATKARLIADADLSANVHEIEASGDFGRFQFRIWGNSLPDNPRSSALAAMSVISKLDQMSSPVMT